MSPEAACAETEVVADHQPAHATAVDENAVDEVRGRQLSQPAAEVLDEHALDAGGLQSVELVAQVGDACRRLLGGEEFTRMRLEGHHRRSQPARAGRAHDLRQKCLVTAMHAVEIADGQRHRDAHIGGGQPAKDLHSEGEGRQDGATGQRPTSA
jgi:hypothetical protein